MLGREGPREATAGSLVAAPGRGRDGWRGVVAGGLVVVLGIGAFGCGPDAEDPATQGSGGRERSGSESAAGDAGEDDGCDVVGGSGGGGSGGSGGRSGGGDGGDRDPGEPAETTSVDVSLTEYGIAAEPAEVPAGPTEMVVANDGRIWHELVLVRFDGDPGALPLNPFGGADEDRIPEDDIVGKVREFLAGTTCTATFDLAPGRYALICNLVDDGSNPHYSQGMYSSFIVR